MSVAYFKQIGRLAVGAGLAFAVLLPQADQAQAQDPKHVDQGGNWTTDLANQFYSQDQGSRIMPLAWFTALKQPGGTKPFLVDDLARYGYLSNPASPATPRLPVGFTTNGTGKDTHVGMTCAACHTRQITEGSDSWRIDGGPAIVDFQAFMTDLDRAVAPLITPGAAFDAFAVAVLGGVPSQDKKDKLLKEVQDWYQPYHAIVVGSMPTPAWGPGRLDAVSMIINRVTGLDIGKKSDNYVITENIKFADAPTRYPFLWNASIQDMTQWPGFAPNGNDLFAMSRNVGEVFGVFAHFHPQPYVLLTDYISENSANFTGLEKLETLIKPDKLGAPKWPFERNNDLAKTGEAIFNRPTGSGGCVECHGITPTKLPFRVANSWATPIMDVGTDSREYDVLVRPAYTGELEGSRKPFSVDFYGKCDSAVTILGNNVIGSIAEYAALQLIKAATDNPEQIKLTALSAIQKLNFADKLDDVLKDPRFRAVLEGFLKPTKSATPAAVADAAAAEPDCKKKPQANPPYAYESRVMNGIWAAAPYLHNGSVPTLADLLNPVQERPASFAVGQAYDKNKVGLATTQTQFATGIITTTDCYQRNSGNSRCGHEFGTSLTKDEKKALLEYLKLL